MNKTFSLEYCFSRNLKRVLKSPEDQYFFIASFQLPSPSTKSSNETSSALVVTFDVFSSSSSSMSFFVAFAKKVGKYGLEIV